MEFSNTSGWSGSHLLGTIFAPNFRKLEILLDSIFNRLGVNPSDFPLFSFVLEIGKQKVKAKRELDTPTLAPEGLTKPA